MAARSITHRFVVVYVQEHREIPGAPDLWRGHVTYVSSGPPDVEVGSRVAFEALEELPPILRRLLHSGAAQRSDGPDAAAGAQERAT